MTSSASESTKSSTEGRDEKARLMTPVDGE